MSKRILVVEDQPDNRQIPIIAVTSYAPSALYPSLTAHTKDSPNLSARSHSRAPHKNWVGLNFGN